MRREIGSEFWDIPISKTSNDLFDKNAQWFISGTAALETIIDDIKRVKHVKTAALPSWCCSSMIIPFIKNDIKVVFYPVYMEECKLINNYRGITADCWLVLSYFGYTSQINQGSPSGIIIRDLTHSLLSEQFDDADYYFGSLRKWAGFYTGGYAWGDKWNSSVDIPNCDQSYFLMRENAMKQKSDFIKGFSDSKSYLVLFNSCEDYLDHCKPMRGSSRDVESALFLDVNKIKAQRRKNATILLEKLSKVAMFDELQDNDCPLFVPILLENKKRNALRSYLIKNNIYCPIHWTIENVHELTNRTKEIYDTELSIVCDQRYDEKDMYHIIKVIDESYII